MKKQTQTRFLTLMLALCLMITSLVLPTFADEGASSATDSIGVGASPGENATITGAERAESAEEAKLRYLAERANHVPTRSLDDVISDGGSSFASAEAIELNTYYTAVAEEYDEKTYFYIELETEGFFTFESTNADFGVPLATLYNENQQELVSDDDITFNENDEGFFNFSFTYYLHGLTRYYFSVSNDCSNEALICDFRVRVATSAEDINAVELEVGETYNVGTVFPYFIQYYKITPAATRKYYFFSSDYADEGDPEIYLYDSSLTMIAYNCDIFKNNNFRLSVTLNAGQTYYIAARNYDMFYGAFTLNVYGPAPIASTNAYYIKNVGTGKYISVKSPDTQEQVSQRAPAHISTMQWQIRHVTGTEYNKIMSEFGSNKCIGISNETANSNETVLYTNAHDMAKWNIYLLPNWKFIFEPKNSPEKILFAPDSSENTRLQITDMWTADNKAKWEIAHVAAFIDNHAPTPSFSIQYIGTEANRSVWLPSLQASINAWNNSGAGTSISLTSSTSSYTCNVSSYGETSWYGRVYPIVEEGFIIGANIQINTDKVSDYENARQSTIVHEIGHILGLADDPPVGRVNDSIMSYGRIRESVYMPKPYDIYNVKFIY